MQHYFTTRCRGFALHVNSYWVKKRGYSISLGVSTVRLSFSCKLLFSAGSGWSHSHLEASNRCRVLCGHVVSGWGMVAAVVEAARKMRLTFIIATALAGSGKPARTRSAHGGRVIKSLHVVAAMMPPGVTHREKFVYIFFPEVCQLCGSSFKLNVWLHITNCLHTLEVLAN